MTLPLASKIALVTGSSRGIGAAIARRLAADGAAVLVHFNTRREQGQSVVDDIKASGGLAELVGADLSRLDGPKALITQFDLAFDGRFAGRLDVLVNNAGTFAFGSLADATDEAFDTLFNLNVRAMFQLSREAARRMTLAGWGRIINTGSVFGDSAPMPGMSLYCGTKFAVQGLTRAWSRDLGPKGITVNNVQPALILSKPDPASGPEFDAMKRFNSVGRFGKPNDIAEAVAFLASPKAGFVNGESLNVDGGWLA